jgi:coatomer subunit zeta
MGMISDLTAGQYVVGSADENEILLFNVIVALRDSLNLLLKSDSSTLWILFVLILQRNQIDKRTVIENYDLVSLAVDEIVDDGIILETDPVIVATRVSRPPAQDSSSIKVDLSEQGLLNLLEFGKKTLRNGL